MKNIGLSKEELEKLIKERAAEEKRSNCTINEARIGGQKMKTTVLNPEVIKKIQQQKEIERKQAQARVKKTAHWFGR